MNRPQPVRTCVGCRQRAVKSELLRVVVSDEGARGDDGHGARVVPDERGRKPGRGAHLHLDQACLDLAERRRAFPRALRHTGPLDLSDVRRMVEEQHRRASPESPAPETQQLGNQ